MGIAIFKNNSADENLPQKPSDIFVFLPQGLKKKIKDTF